MEKLSKPASILIVDDSPDNIHLMSQALVKVGHHVRAAKDAEIALGLAQENPPDLILLDIEMPGMSGYDLCTILKTINNLKDIPVIFISVHDKPINKVRAFEVGGVDYVSKPIHAEELVNRASTHIDLYRLHHKLRQEVEHQTKELQDALIALRVLASQQKLEVSETEKTVLSNIRTNITPLVQRLKKTTLDEKQGNMVDLILGGLDQISKSLINNQDLLAMRLTPVEMQIVHIIKEGKRTKEIADIFNLSELTVSTHRKNIRKKLEIEDRSVSLYTYLSTL